MFKKTVMFAFGILLIQSSLAFASPSKPEREKLDTRFISFQCFQLDENEGYSLFAYDHVGNLITKPISERLSHKACFWTKDGLNQFTGKFPLSVGKDLVFTCKSDVDGATRVYAVAPGNRGNWNSAEKVVTVFGNSKSNRWDRCEEIALGTMGAYQEAPSKFDDFLSFF